MDIKESKELSFDTQDFPKEVWVFDADNLDQGTEISHLMMSHAEQYTKDELLEICRQASMVIDQLRAELAKAQAVPNLGELQERIAGHQYYHDEHGHMIVDMDDVVKEISGFDSWNAQAVPEGFVLVKADNVNSFYQDDNEPENFCNSCDDLDALGDLIDRDEIMIVNKHTSAHISTEKFYGAWGVIETSYGTAWKFKLFNTENEARSAIVEAQEPAND